MFQVGERVLCVDGSRWGQCPRGSSFQLQYCPNLPTRGVIYTVRALWGEGTVWGADSHLHLVEVINYKNASRHGPVEPVFECIQFVPLKRVETDISIFTQMLVPQRRKVSA